VIERLAVAEEGAERIDVGALALRLQAGAPRRFEGRSRLVEAPWAGC